MLFYLSAGAVAGAGIGIVTELLVPGAVCGAGASCLAGAVCLNAVEGFAVKTTLSKINKTIIAPKVQVAFSIKSLVR